MIVISIDEFIELKNIIYKLFKLTLHIHDTCQGQYFSVDKQNEELKCFIENYFKEKNIKTEFDNSGLIFSLEQL